MTCYTCQKPIEMISQIDRLGRAFHPECYQEMDLQRSWDVFALAMSLLAAILALIALLAGIIHLVKWLLW